MLIYLRFRACPSRILKIAAVLVVFTVAVSVGYFSKRFRVRFEAKSINKVSTWRFSTVVGEREVNRPTEY